MQQGRTLDVCLTPALIHLHDISNSVVVVIDILRATSSITIAFEYGVKSIVPVASIEESQAYRKQGYLVGAERNGEMLEGFDLGNSPFSYMVPEVNGRHIALSTTNGTQAVNAAKHAKRIAVGSFLNLDALCNWLMQQEENVLLLCAGWKNSFNLEDTLFAGAVVSKLESQLDFTPMRDSALAAKHLYDLAKGNMNEFLQDSSHRKRLQKLRIEEDIEFCLQLNKSKAVPVMIDGALVNVNTGV